MNVLLQIHSDYNKSISGDSVQFQKIVEYLKMLGVKVHVSTSADEDLSSFDLVHLFNITRVDKAYRFYRNAVNQKKPIVITPIFIDMNVYYKNISPPMYASWRSGNLLRREILQGANLLLPNSHMEAKWIKEILLVDTEYKVIYLGVDSYMAEGDETLFVNQYGIENFILCVGRISPLKNQLSLIKAIADMGIKTVLIGPVNDLEYAKECAKHSKGLVKYIPQLNHKEMSSAYKASNLHIQPSFFETVGLTSLEAAASGTPVIVTEKGGAREYFGSMASYVDPYSEETIKKAVMERYNVNCEKDNKLKEFILENYTWEKAAKETLEAYKKALEKPYKAPDRIMSYFSREYKIERGDKR